nr:PilN domain-containing protein [Aquabacterium terrae]
MPAPQPAAQVPPAVARLNAELARLRALEAAQRGLRTALASIPAAGPAGYSEHLLALARQSQGGLWLTRVDIAPDGSTLQLDGRMTDPRQLPDYLRRLHAEPMFRGRQFTQLSVKAVAPGSDDGAGAVEFTLRGAAAVQP